MMMTLELNNLYLEMLKFPNSPKVYRDLAKYHANLQQLEQANAFIHLLKIRFDQLPDLC